MDDQCDKLAGTVYLIGPTTVQFIAKNVHFYQADLSTCCDDLRSLKKFCKSPEFGAKSQWKAPLIRRYTNTLTTHGWLSWRKPPCQNQLDPYDRCDRTPTTTRRQTERHWHRQTPSHSYSTIQRYHSVFWDNTASKVDVWHIEQSIFKLSTKN